MKNKKNKEFLKKIKKIIEEYDLNDIILDSYLISGRYSYFGGEPESKNPTAELIYCSGYIDSESIEHLHPQILTSKFQLYNESVNSLINGALGKEDNKFNKSTVIRATEIKQVNN